MDVSDGLVGDLSKMLRGAGLTAEIDAAQVPLSPAGQAALRLAPSLESTRLTGGDDYEILCAVAPGDARAFEAAAAASGIAVAAIGVAREGDAPPRFHDGHGHPLEFEAASFRHFR
jgi:thiamine-monophosphate kinase